MNIIGFQAVKEVSSASAFKKGERRSTPDGREWVYVKANSALANGSVAVPDAVTAVDTVSSSVDALGRIVFITEISAGWTVGQFEDGVVVVDAGTGSGQIAKIKTNTVDTLELYPEDALSTALSVADSDITIRTMAEVDKSAITSKIQSAVGIAQVAFAAGEFGWLLTNGDGGVLAGVALLVGANFITGDNTTGQVIRGTTSLGPFDEQSLGICLVAGAIDDIQLVRVNIR